MELADSLLEAVKYNGKTDKISPGGQYVLDEYGTLYNCEGNHARWLETNGLWEGADFVGRSPDYEARMDIIEKHRLARLVCESHIKSDDSLELDYDVHDADGGGYGEIWRRE